MTETPTAKALLDAFERIIIINLPERADRRREIDIELGRAGLSLDHPAVELFSATRPKDIAGFPSLGAHGAFLSHMGVMQSMIDRGIDRALILEDDMAFMPGFASRLPALAEGLNAQPWGILYCHPGEEPEKTPAPDTYGLISLPVDLELIQLHFYGMTRKFAEAAVPFLQGMLARPPGSPEGGPMHVDGAMNWVRQANPDQIALAISPQIARQRASPSDIAGSRWFHRVPILRDLVMIVRRRRKH